MDTLSASCFAHMVNHISNRIEVPLSRVKITLIFMGSVGFVGIAIALWPTIRLAPPGDAWAFEMTALLAVAVVFFGSCALYALWKFFDTAPGLVIDEEGIVDNSSGVSAGRIPWSEITAFHVTTLKKRRFLTIEVRDPGKYVERTPFLKRQLVSLNARYFGGPIQISAIALKIDFDELVDTISRRFEEHRLD